METKKKKDRRVPLLIKIFFAGFAIYMIAIFAWPRLPDATPETPATESSAPRAASRTTTIIPTEQAVPLAAAPTDTGLDTDGVTPDEGAPIDGGGTSAAVPIDSALSPEELAAINAAAERPLFTDAVGLLTPEQAEALNARLTELSDKYNFDVAVAVVSRLDYREARLFAADYYESMGYGRGEGISGCILLLAMEDRDFGFAATGYGEFAFTPEGQEYLDSFFLPYLRDDLYYEGFMGYADGVDEVLAAASDGTPYDGSNIPLTEAERRIYRTVAIGLSVFVGLLLALIISFIHRGRLKSVKPENLAHAYIKEGSFVITDSRENFLYRRTTAVPIPKKTSSSGGGGGGSFRSSSGRSFTGHSGKF